MKMKKLNRKGFTLIELLAVIVIMAIILIVTVPNIIQSINDARVNSIHNLAVSVANSYDTMYGQDLLATDANKVLGDIPERVTNTWKCIAHLDFTSTKGKKNKLADVLGLSKDDVNLGTTAPTMNEGELTTSAITSDTCSAIRLKNGKAEVLLVAKDGGRFYVAQNHTYAISTAAKAEQNTRTA